jgi:hypothetical protein
MKITKEMLDNAVDAYDEKCEHRESIENAIHAALKNTYASADVVKGVLIGDRLARENFDGTMTRVNVHYIQKLLDEWAEKNNVKGYHFSIDLVSNKGTDHTPHSYGAK